MGFVFLYEIKIKSTYLCILCFCQKSQGFNINPWLFLLSRCSLFMLFANMIEKGGGQFSSDLLNMLFH